MSGTDSSLAPSPSRKFREALGYFAAFFAIGLVVAYLTRHHVEQQSNFAEYVNMAEHYAGRVRRSILTYPTWGYPFLLLALPRYDIVAVPQVALAALAATMLLMALRDAVPTHRRAITVLFLVGVPWYVLHSVKWPQSVSTSLSVIACVVLAKALGNRSWVLGAVAGAVAGLALYFRSEFLYFPLFVVLCVIVARFLPTLRDMARRLSIGAGLVWAAVAWLALVPWAIHYQRQTGHYSLTASQRGIVAFISLGQLPNNPWGGVYLDEWGYEYLTDRGITVNAVSDSGDRVLYDEFKRRVKDNPAAFAKKMVWNGIRTAAGGFYNGEIPLSAAENEQFGRLREQLKSRLVPSLAGGDGSAQGEAVSSPRAYAALAYYTAAKAIGALFVVVAVLGVLLLIVRGTTSPLLFVLAAYIGYQMALMLALTTEPRYLNGLYLPMVPFVVAAIAPLAARLRRRRASPA